MDGLRDLFIPDTDYIQTSFNNFVEGLRNKFSIDTSVFENVFNSEQPVEDVYFDYDFPYVGQFKLKVLDASFLQQGVNFFRPLIRGFLVLLLFLFHVKQFIGFFGYDAGVIQGRSDWINYNKANTGGHKE